LINEGQKRSATDLLNISHYYFYVGKEKKNRKNIAKNYNSHFINNPLRLVTFDIRQLDSNTRIKNIPTVSTDLEPTVQPWKKWWMRRDHQ
jgi:hypothetical protein